VAKTDDRQHTCLSRGLRVREIISSIKKPELIARRRKQIMTVAMDLFRKQGYHATTMRQICERSEVNRGSFYDYFGSKEDILVYIFKQMMYRSGDFDKAFAEINIRSFKDLEPYIRDVINISWSANKDLIQLLYRETNALDPETLKAVLRIESDYTRWVANNLRLGLRLPAVTRELEIMANIIIYTHAFMPLRGWNMRHLGKTEIIGFTVDMLMLKLKKLKSELKKKE
jgi:AcrR family transcriptional regulator